jgi:hypothetical protein
VAALVDVVTYAGGVCTAQVAYYDRATSELKHGLAHAATIKSALVARASCGAERSDSRRLTGRRHHVPSEPSLPKRS